eukprot:165848-Prorocentrum_lima.AAC.1
MLATSWSSNETLPTKRCQDGVDKPPLSILKTYGSIHVKWQGNVLICACKDVRRTLCIGVSWSWRLHVA